MATLIEKRKREKKKVGFGPLLVFMSAGKREKGKKKKKKEGTCGLPSGGKKKGGGGGRGQREPLVDLRRLTVWAFARGRKKEKKRGACVDEVSCFGRGGKRLNRTLCVLHLQLSLFRYRAR